jgi:hypothetical protein
LSAGNSCASEASPLERKAPSPANIFSCHYQGVSYAEWPK